MLVAIIIIISIADAALKQVAAWLISRCWQWGFHVILFLCEFNVDWGINIFVRWKKFDTRWKHEISIVARGEMDDVFRNNKWHSRGGFNFSGSLVYEPNSYAKKSPPKLLQQPRIKLYVRLNVSLQTSNAGVFPSQIVAITLENRANILCVWK